jgi:hypothetical protein
VIRGGGHGIPADRQVGASASRIVPRAHLPLTPVLAETSTVAVKTKGLHANKITGGSLTASVECKRWVPVEDAISSLSRDRLLCVGSHMQMLTPPPDEPGFGPPPMSSDNGRAYDWTASLPQSDHITFFRTTDWSRTSLGPLNSWSPTLRLFASYVLSDSRGACLWWGDISNLTAIYNEAYAPLAAGVHPKLMGSVFQEGYPDLWPSISQYFIQAKRTGTGVNYSSATATIVERKGYKEEAFFSGGFVPVGMPGAIEGYINTT